MSGYAVNELFLTLQGEGMQAGRRAVFVRFAGCNLWSGREADRASAECRFCDTDFVGTGGTGGGRYPDADALAAQVVTTWGLPPDAPGRRFVVVTGGEPTLQLDAPLVAALKAAGFEIAIETNGTRPVPAGVDWICVSPKAGTRIVQRTGDELKLVWPQPGLDPDAMAAWDFRHFLVSPMDGHATVDTRAAAIAFVLEHPRWRLSLQTHKLVGIR